MPNGAPVRSLQNVMNARISNAAALFLSLALALPLAANTANPSVDPILASDIDVAEFTRRQLAADYPTKFRQAAEEFDVPAEILMGVAFVQTRHEHLLWPPGQGVSPQTGMPRPFGIMSLWDNQWFGQSLRDAARLIGKSPEELKRDPLQNIRGAAALLRRHYDQGEKPPYARENSLESWKYAIAKFSGIPDRSLAHQHAFEVFDWLSRGYDQYGITLPQVPNLDLVEMWEETRRIRAQAGKDVTNGINIPAPADKPTPVQPVPAEVPAGNLHAQNRSAQGATNVTRAPVEPPPGNWTIWLGLVIFSAVWLGLVLLRGKRK